MRTRTRNLELVAGLALGALALAACGSSQSSTNSSPSDAGASSSVDATESSAGSASAAPAPVGEAVKIGLINQENETVAFPEGSAAAKAVVAYLNAEKGGIGGRPAELVLCTAGDAPESAVACANQFANDPTVPLVIDNTYNSAAVNEVLLGRKALLSFNNDIPDMTTPNAFTLDPGVLVPSAVIAGILKQKGATTVSVLYTDDPLIKDAVLPLFELALANVGITVEQTVPVISGGDYAAAVAAADPTGVDGLAMLLVDTAQCAPVGKALKDLGSTAVVASADICSAPVAAETGDLDGWQFAVTNTGTFDPSMPGPGTLELRRIIETYGEGEPNFATLAGFTAANVFAAADIYEKVGVNSLTPEAINALLSAGWKAEPLKFPPVACPGTAPFIGGCGTSMFWAEIQDGKLGAVQDGAITVDMAQFADLVQ